MTLICIKQHLSSIWSSIHEKVKQNRGCWKKALLIKKREQLKISFGKKTGAAAQMFSCEFCEIFENTYFEEHLQKAVSMIPFSLFLKFPAQILSFFIKILPRLNLRLL